MSATLQFLQDMFAPKRKSGATKKGHVHQHNPTWKPPKAELTPAQWHRMRRGKPAPYNYEQGR